MFKTSIQKLKSTKNLTIIALLIATKIAIGSIYIPVGDNLRIYFKFFSLSSGQCFPQFS